MRVLVTGASGFLGHAVCHELRTRGHDTTAVIRRPGSEPAGTAPVYGELQDVQSLVRAVAEVRPDAVLHLAAETATQRSPVKIAAVNIAGTSHLLEACAEADPGTRFVFVSTAVTGDAGGAVLTEDSQLPVETAYGRSKQEGERLVRAAGIHDVILRPSHVYGPGGWYAEEIVKRLEQAGRFAVIGRGQNWWDVVRVEDVASACVDAAEQAPPGSLYHVVDDEPITYEDFVGLTAKALGLGAPRHIPPWIARIAAGDGPIKAAMRSARSSNERIRRELGWSPRFPTAEQGVPDAVAQLKG